MSVKVNDWIHAAATEAAAKLREKLKLIESKESKAQEVTDGYSK